MVMADVDCLAVTFCLEQVCACVDYGTMELYVPYEEARDVLPPRNHFYNTIWFRGGSGTLPLPKNNLSWQVIRDERGEPR